MDTFSAGSALGYGWRTFTKRPWFLMGAMLLVGLLMWLINVLAGASEGNVNLSIVSSIVSLVLSTLIDMGLTTLALRAHDDIEHASINDLWNPARFVTYLFATILVAIAVVGGFILLIVPGIILAIMFMFVKLVVIDRDLGVIASLRESARITRGRRFELLLLGIAIAGINVLGALALLVGLLVTVPFTMIAMAHAYRTLAHAAPAADLAAN